MRSRRWWGRITFAPGLSNADEALVSLIVDVQRCGGARIPTLAEVEQADAVLVLGEDILNTAPRLALAVRQSVRNLPLELAEAAGIPQWQEAGVSSHGQEARSPLLVASLLPTELDDIAEASCNTAPDGLAAIGYEIAHSINPAFAPADGPDGAGADFVQRGGCCAVSRAPTTNNLRHVPAPRRNC